MRVVFIENHDSFSFNVIDALPVSRDEIEIEHAQGESVMRSLAKAQVVVIGPGPKDPQRAGLLPIVAACEARRIPLLGICLGHQALGLHFGAQLIRHEPCHGHRAVARFVPSRHFGVTGDVEVMRYHSLALSDVQVPLQVIASLSDGTVMAIEHASLPMAGLQFHPDSFGTPSGRQLVRSFFQRVTRV